MKMQIAFRRLIGQKFAGYDVVAAVGLVDFPASEHRIHECVADLNLPISVNGSKPTGAFYYGNAKHLERATDWNTLMHLRSADLEDALKAPIQRTEPSEISNTHLLFRETAVQSQHHMGRVYAFVGTLCVANSQRLDVRDILEFSSTLKPNESGPLKLVGRVGRTIRQHFGTTDLEASTRGRGLSSFLQEPIWGFGKEPIALGSTLDLDKQSAYESYLDLFFEEKETDVDRARYLTFMRMATADGRPLLEDEPVLARILWRVRQSDDYVPPLHPKTRAQFHAVNAAMHEASLAIQNGEDDDYFEEWRRKRSEESYLNALSAPPI